ncbi:UNVERIFIED_CONTAM: hypothetical protein FKN15_068179 [Acipenser sinensis]
MDKKVNDGTAALKEQTERWRQELGLPDPEPTELDLLLQKWERELELPSQELEREEPPLPEPRGEEPPLPEPRGEEVKSIPPPQPRPPPLLSSPASLRPVPRPLLLDTLSVGLDLPSLDREPRSRQKRSQFSTWSPASLLPDTKTLLHCSQMSLTLLLVTASLPLGDWTSLHWVPAVDLCPLLQPPVPRLSFRSPLSNCWGPSSPERGPYLAEPGRGPIHPPVHPWKRARKDIYELEEQEPEDEESVHPQPKAPLAREEYLLVSPPPPPSEGKEQELPLHPHRQLVHSSEGIWDWLAEPERDIVEALPAVINLLWARDGERWRRAAGAASVSATPKTKLPLSPPPPGGEQQELPLSPPPPGGEQQELPLSPPPPGAEQQELPLPLPPPPPSAEGEYLLVLPQPPWEDCLPLPPPSAKGEYLLVPPPPSWEGLLLPCLAPPKDACLALPKDACLAPPKDACLAPPGAACCSASPGEPPVTGYEAEVELPLPPPWPGAPLPSSPPEGPLLLPPPPEGRDC